MTEPPELQVYLVRHGETEWARDGRHTGRTDIPLTDTGRTQAGFLLPVFDGMSLGKILSSPLQRALETARFAGLGARVELCPDLMEWDYGDYEGLRPNRSRKRFRDGRSGRIPVRTGKPSNKLVSELIE